MIGHITLNTNVKDPALEQRRNRLASALAFLLPLLIPSIQMSVMFYHFKKMEIDKEECINSCFDTVFKGPYEHGVAGFKHVYFNSDRNTFKMWCLTLVGAIGMYEAFKQFFSLWFRRRLRISLGVLFLGSVYSLYCTWWGFWNYWNDDYYRKWNRELVFAMTELVSTKLVWDYLDRKRSVEVQPMLVVCCVALVRAALGTSFAINAIHGKVGMHQLLQDFAFFFCDVLRALVALYEIRSQGRKSGTSLRTTLISNRLHVRTVVVVVGTMLICALLFPEHTNSIRPIIF